MKMIAEQLCKFTVSDRANMRALLMICLMQQEQEMI